MAKRGLTPWQRLARIAYKYDISIHGLDVPEIERLLVRNRKVSDDDKRRVKEIMEEWARTENQRHSYNAK